MPKTKRRTSLGELIEKYSNYSVVEEIEKNLSSFPRSDIPMEKLLLHPLFDEKNYALDLYSSLKESLKNDGFLSPLILVPASSSQYYVINGVKRYLLGKSLGYTSFPGVEADLTKERVRLYILENIVAENDCPLVKTTCFSRLLKEKVFTAEDIAAITSLSLSQVRNLIRLDNLPEFLKEGLRERKLTYGEARALLSLDEKDQKEIYQRILSSPLSVREIESYKRKVMGRTKKTKVTLHKRSVTITFEDEEKARRAYPSILKSFSD